MLLFKWQDRKEKIGISFIFESIFSLSFLFFFGDQFLSFIYFLFFWGGGSNISFLFYLWSNFSLSFQFFFGEQFLSREENEKSADRRDGDALSEANGVAQSRNTCCEECGECVCGARRDLVQVRSLITHHVRMLLLQVAVTLQE